MIYLSSFFGRGQGPRYSIARWAPKNFRGDRDTLSWLGARSPDGSPLRRIPPEEFRRLYFGYLLTSCFDKLYDWLDSLNPGEDITLCCWCTPERQRPHPKLFCHRILVGRIIEERRPDVPIAYVDGAENPVWPRSKPQRGGGCPHAG